MAVQTPPQGRVGWHHALLVLSALCLGALLGHLASEHAVGAAEPSESSELLAELRANRAEMRELREKVATLEEGHGAQRRQLQEGPACQSSDEVNFAAIRAATVVSEAFGNFSANVQPGLLASKETFDSFSAWVLPGLSASKAAFDSCLLGI